MTRRAVPFLLMRGGSSRGPYMQREDLPAERDALAQVLVAIIGAGHPLNIDGIGGGASVTTKVAMLSPGGRDGSVDYFFAQVGVDEAVVDFKPTCGNILVGVGPAAIEMGLVPATSEITEVVINLVNTGARVLARVQTPNGQVTYEGKATVDGIPGSAAPVELSFLDAVGGLTGAMFPTGKRCEEVEGIKVTCIDVAMPMVIARAADFGLTGTETAAVLDANRGFFARMEAIRRAAGVRMGLGDVSRSVVPKFGMVAPPVAGGLASVRYFTPWSAHPNIALTGAQCLGACLICPGTVAEGVIAGRAPVVAPARLTLEHPGGKFALTADYRLQGNGFEWHSAMLVRTARKLAQGELFVPEAAWPVR